MAEAGVSVQLVRRPLRRRTSAVLLHSLRMLQVSTIAAGPGGTALVDASYKLLYCKGICRGLLDRLIPLLPVLNELAEISYDTGINPDVSNWLGHVKEFVILAEELNQRCSRHLYNPFDRFTLSEHALQVKKTCDLLLTEAPFVALRQRMELMRNQSLEEEPPRPSDVSQENPGMPHWLSPRAAVREGHEENAEGRVQTMQGLQRAASAIWDELTITELLDKLVEDAGRVVVCRKLCRELQRMLERLQLVLIEVVSSPNVTQGVSHWLSAFRNCLYEALKLTEKCSNRQPLLRFGLSEHILRVAEQLEFFSAQAPFVILRLHLQEFRTVSQDFCVNMTLTNSSFGLGSPAVRAPFSAGPWPRWEKLEELGRGAYATVYKGRNKDDDSLFAVKVMRFPSGAGQSSSDDPEIAVLTKLDHPNIVRYYGSGFDETGHRCIFLELMHQSLNQKLGKGLEERVIRTYTRQILRGLTYLHENGIIHRDIKCANILLSSDSCQVRLADFGVAKQASEAFSFKGTVPYMAPELIANHNPDLELQASYGTAVDVWSLGCTILEMADGRPPWQGLLLTRVFSELSQRRVPPIPQHLSLEAKNFIRDCLCFEPEERPTANQLLQHPFLAVPAELISPSDAA